jgi:hypothetical protein
MNQNVDAVKEIQQSEFWYSYLDLMLLIQPTLTNRERDVMATLLNYEYKSPAFPRGRAKEVAPDKAEQTSEVDGQGDF